MSSKTSNGMRILIATGIYPPDIGGPAEYAKNLETVFKKQGHTVVVRHFTIEKKLPTGIRHLVYFFRILPTMWRTEVVFALDTWSAALPAFLAARMFGKKFIIRTGGDFLWESYVERTGDLVLLKNFYQKSRDRFSRKERIIFSLTRWLLRAAHTVIFSTEWQRNIFIPVYSLAREKTGIVENYYGPKEVSYAPERKNFIAGARPLKWKNIARLVEAFSRATKQDGSIEFQTHTERYPIFMENLAHAYAVILVSLGDISPNLILDAVRHNKPFIVTRETGLYDRIKSCALFVDPENVDDIAEKILWLSVPENYAVQKKKVEAFTFTHTWKDIANEFLAVTQG